MKGVEKNGEYNIAQLDSIIGHKGELNKGVYKYTIGRPDVQLVEHEVAPVIKALVENGIPIPRAQAGEHALRLRTMI